ncbi:MAG: hypothetical protein N2255_04155 [Kiritimatiellae bacterium]|nr:hypothetical protein [Kiritimatiellia bacterium]
MNESSGSFARRSLGQSFGRLSLVVFLAFATGCFGFVLLRRNVVLNRFTDSWWHIAAADEYARTGVLAKDPFFENAPRFAQFGLMDFVTAKLARMFDQSPHRMFVFVLAADVVVFLTSAFLAGWWTGGNTFVGLLAALIWVITFPGSSIISIGFPFATATSLLALFIAAMLRLPGGRCGPVPCLWRGMLLGVIFDLHAFVGLMGLAVAVGWLVWGLRQYRKEAMAARGNIRVESAPTTVKFLRDLLCFGGAFFLTALPWLLLHAKLRPVLATVNAHVRAESPLDPRAVTGLALGLAATGLGICLFRHVPEQVSPNLPRANAAVSMPLRALAGFGLFGIFLLVCGLPPVNKIICRQTSWYMANRVPWLFPTGPVLALAALAAFYARGRVVVQVCRMVTLGLMFVLLLRPARNWFALNFHLLRTHEYDSHAYGYLETLAGEEGSWKGQVVLADPSTSYYLRGMLGARVLTVIPGVASPAVDYNSRDLLVRNLLANGPDRETGHEIFHAVLLDKKNGSTRRFTGRTVEEIVDKWIKQGWRLSRDERDFVLLVPRSVQDGR